MEYKCASCKHYSTFVSLPPCERCNFNSNYEPKRKSRSKFIKGERITTLDELFKQEYIYMNGKVYHKGWFRMWQFKMAFDCLYNSRGVYHAVKVVD